MTTPADGLPPGLAERGAALWAAIMAEHELTPAEAVLLVEAARAADLLDRLQGAVVAGGVTMPWGDAGVRMNPAVPEIRAQRLALARLVAALDLPAEEPAAASREWSERQRARRSA